MEQQNQQHPSPSSEHPVQSAEQEPASPERAPMGPVIAAIVIVAVLAIGGLYYWGSKTNQKAQEEQVSTPTTTAEVTAPTPEELEAVSENTDLSTIEDELQFDTGNLDAELENLEAELQF